MMTPDDAARVLDTILSTPGMNEAVRIDLKITRKNVLLLSHIIQLGTGGKSAGQTSVMLAGMPGESLEELRQFAEECLQKAGMTQLNEKLSLLTEIKKN